MTKEIWIEGNYPDDSDSQPRSLESDIERLVEVCHKVLKNGLDRHRKELSDATIDVSEWMEQSDDPMENGWVNGNGTP